MIKFQIIIDKKGFKKKVKTSKGFLNRISSSLALVLSILILSTIIGLGIHLVLAEVYTNPEYDPPLGNVDMPINVSDVSQIKEGKLDIVELWQYNAVNPAEPAWQLNENGDLFGVNIGADNAILGFDIKAENRLWIEGKIYALNQNWEHEIPAVMSKTLDPDTVYITCPDGWFLRKVQIHKDGRSSQGWCAAPFEKAVDALFGGNELEEFTTGWGERAKAKY